MIQCIGLIQNKDGIHRTVVGYRAVVRIHGAEIGQGIGRIQDRFRIQCSAVRYRTSVGYSAFVLSIDLAIFNVNRPISGFF